MIFLEDSFEEAGLGLQMEGLRRSHVDSRSQGKERTQAGWTHRDTIRQGKWLERHGSAAHGAMPADGGFSATGWGFSLIHCGHPWTKYTGLILDGVGQLCGVLLWLLYSWNAGSLQTGDKKATKFNEERKAVHFHAIDFYSLFTCLLRVVSFTCDSLFSTAQHFSQVLLSYWLGETLSVQVRQLGETGWRPKDSSPCLVTHSTRA